MRNNIGNNCNLLYRKWSRLILGIIRLKIYGRKLVLRDNLDYVQFRVGIRIGEIVDDPKCVDVFR